MTTHERRDHRIPIRTIKHGSALYGTRTASSDVDTKGIVLPSADDILLRGALDRSDRTTTKSDPNGTNAPSDADSSTSSLSKYLEQLVAGDPSAVDVLFAPSWADLHEPHPIWWTITRNRARLVNRDMLPRMLSYCRAAEGSESRPPGRGPGTRTGSGRVEDPGTRGTDRTAGSRAPDIPCRYVPATQRTPTGRHPTG